jgi:hypothetical protein
MTQALTKEWYMELEKAESTNFINLPIQFQMRNYTYGSISKSYLQFLQCPENTRSDKLSLARKFLKFIRSINKNRAKEELNEHFFLAFQYFMDNFQSLLSMPDNIHLETLQVLTEAIDKSQFIEDVLSIEDLQRRITALKQVETHEQSIDAEWTSFESEYREVQDVQPLLTTEPTVKDGLLQVARNDGNE